jgi:AcrR family transcriptional regulator
MGAKKVQERPAARMPAEDRREQILEVAIRLFSQKGFRGTTTKEIALAAGVNEAIIFRHFATKRDLYTAIIDRKCCSAQYQALEQVIHQAMSRGDDRQVFESIAFHILEFHEQDDTAMRVLLYSALEGHELAEMAFHNQMVKNFRRLADYIKQRITDGAFRRVDPMTAVRAFFGMIVYHAQINKFFARDGCELLNISNRQAATRFADLFLGGISPPEREAKRR